MPTTMDHSRERHWPAGRFDEAKTNEPRHESHLAYVLDRVLYWDRVRDACDHPDKHYSFIIHGAIGQGVQYFLSRIERSFNRHGRLPHKVIQVFSDADIGRTIIAQDWTRHLCHALHVNDLVQAIRDSARDEAVMLIFRHEHGPLHCKRDADDVVGLDDAECTGLFVFLADLLPAAVIAAKPAHPVRVLVPIEYSSHRSRDPLFRGVETALLSLKNIEYRQIPPLEWPPFSDVWISIEDFLKPKRPPPDLEQRCHQIYDDVTRTRGTFEQLADVLDHELEQCGGDL
jgi:hypothetical protein